MDGLLLLGDSIRMHYQPIVRELLAGKLMVSGPAENGETTRKTIARLDSWLSDGDFAVIHLNCGLHDLRYNEGESSPQVPLDEYEENLRRIFGLLREQTAARLIWATTTPVNEQLHEANKLSRRYMADVERYNASSVRIAKTSGLEINDLCAAMKETRDGFFNRDGVHFTREGYRFLAERVAAFVTSG